LIPGGADFNVPSVAVGNHSEIVAMYDGIAISSRAGPDAVSDLADARDLLILVAASYALITGHAYSISFEGWIEAHETTVTDSTIGFRVQRPPHLRQGVPSARTQRSMDMRRAAGLAGAIFREPGWRLAVRDVHSAHLERGDDAFVFGYRAIEDLARAVTGKTSQLRREDWERLHKHLGTTGDPKLVSLRKQRDAILKTSRLTVAQALSRSTLPLEAKQVRK
jgi:hypothetical protein